MTLTLKATIYADDVGQHPSKEYLWVESWLEKWAEKVAIVNYSSGGWEHLWDVSGPIEAIEEIPSNLLCGSDWAGIHCKSKL